MKAILYDYIVEWDDAKNEINYQKHGIRFETAAYILMIRTGLNTTMKSIVMGKIDIIRLGKVGDVMFVVYTERGEALRLISARYATKAEEELYYGNC